MHCVRLNENLLLEMITRERNIYRKKNDGNIVKIRSTV